MSSSSTPTSPTTGRPGTLTVSTATPTVISLAVAARVVVTTGPGEAAVQVEFAFGVIHGPCRRCGWPPGSDGLVVDTDVDWHEHDRLLKVACPSTSTPTARRRRSSSGTSNGRPTTILRGTPPGSSTSPTGSCMSASPAYGVAVVNAGIYGHEVSAAARAGRRPGHRGPAVDHPQRRLPRPTGRKRPPPFPLRHRARAPPSPMPSATATTSTSPLRPVMAERGGRAAVDGGQRRRGGRGGKGGGRPLRRRRPALLRVARGAGHGGVSAGFPVRSASVTDLLERTLNELTVQDNSAVTMQIEAVRGGDAEGCQR